MAKDASDKSYYKWKPAQKVISCWLWRVLKELAQEKKKLDLVEMIKMK